MLKTMTSFLMMVVVVMLAAPALACSVAEIPECPTGEVFSTFECGCIKDASSPTPAAMSQEEAELITSAPPAHYTGCKSDSDCTAEAGVCHYYVAVNTKYAAHFKQASRMVNRAIACATTGPQGPAPESQCLSGRCELNNR